MRNCLGIAVMTTGLAAAGTALGGAHTWDVNEVFSNADGTIQFIELREANGTPNEVNLNGRPVSADSTGNVFVIPSNVVGPTSNKHLLLATAGFAALPGAPTPDHIIPAGSVPFFNINGDTVRYEPYDAFTFGPVPTDGVMSMNDGGVVATNTPTNYAGVTGTVDAGGADCPGDVNGDNIVDLDDLLTLLANFNAGPGGDADGDGDTDLDDLLLLLANFGAAC